MKLHNYLDNLTGNNVLKFHIRTIDRFRDIEQTLIFGYLKFIFFITIVACDLINYRNLMKLDN